MSYVAYDDWGVPVGGDVSVAEYTGHMYDVVLGVYYARARMYSSEDRRFVSVDPIQDGLNWYVYCNDNPLKYVDPKGLSPLDELKNLIGMNSPRSTEYEGKTYYSIEDIFNSLPKGLFASSGYASISYGPYGTISMLVITYDLNNVKKGIFGNLKKSMITGDVTLYNKGINIPGGSINILYDKGVTYVNFRDLLSYFEKAFCDTSIQSTPQPQYTPGPELMEKSFLDFLEALGFKESENNYGIVNSLGYMGKYQFGSIALRDIGFYDNNNWTLKANDYGVYSKETFLNNPTAQEAAIRMLLKNNWKYATIIKQLEKEPKT